jgi:hypothetical protein
MLQDALTFYNLMINSEVRRSSLYQINSLLQYIKPPNPQFWGNLKTPLGLNSPRIGGRGAVRQDLYHCFLDLVLVMRNTEAFEQPYRDFTEEWLGREWNHSDGKPIPEGLGLPLSLRSIYQVCVTPDVPAKPLDHRSTQW